MNVACWSCRAIFRVDPALVPAAGTQARCSRCDRPLMIPSPVGERIGAPVASLADPWGDWGPPRDDWFADEADRLPDRSARRALVESEAEAAPEVSWAPPRPRAPVSAPTPAVIPASVPSPARESAAHERARRLARALVSDLVVYHPERREAALMAGTLRVVFREEIAEAHAAYVTAVGTEMAERTSYFAEALNEFLARGRALF